MKTARFFFCVGLFVLALFLGAVAAFFHLLAWPFYVGAIALAKGINYANRNTQSTPHLVPPNLRNVPARVPAETR